MKNFWKNTESGIEQRVIGRIPEIKITSTAFEKANYISKRVSELMGSSVEVGFFLLDDKPKDNDQDSVIRDIYIGHDQNVSGTRCDISGLGKIKSFRDINNNLNKRIVGWGHSHGSMSTFYSHTDDNTILDMLDGWAIKNEIHINPELTSKINSIGLVNRDNKVNLEIILEGGNSFYIPNQLFDNFNKSIISELPYYFFKDGKNEIDYLIGMTFNERGDDPFCVIAYKNFDGPKKLEDNVKFEIVGEPREEIDKEYIDKTLIERVNNLKVKYENRIEITEEDQRKAQVTYFQIQQMNSRIISSRYPTTHLGLDDQLSKLKNLLSLLEVFNDLYEKSDSENITLYFNSGQERDNPVIEDFRNKSIRNIAAYQQFYIDYRSKVQKLLEDGKYLIYDKQKADNLLGLYERVIGITQQYLNQGDTEFNRHLEIFHEIP